MLLLIADVTCNQYVPFNFFVCFLQKKLALDINLISLVYRNSYTTILNRMLPQLQKHIETMYDRYMDSYSFKYIKYFYSLMFFQII